MKRLAALVCILTSLPALAAPARSRSTETIAVTQPTVIAFFPLAANASHEGESLEDFQFYVREDGRQLRRAGIRVQETYAEIFRLRVGSSVKVVRPEGGQSGYYFIAPGREPKIVYGVTTDDELLQLAQDYFKKPAL